MEISSIEAYPSRFTPKMIRQLQSIKNLAKNQVKLTKDVHALQRRAVSIRSAEDLFLGPYESSVIKIKTNRQLAIANHHFVPTRQNKEPYALVHIPEGIINSDNLWLPIQNTSNKIVKLQKDSRVGIACRLNEYEIAQPADGDVHIDAVTIMCSDNDEIQNPWEHAEDLYNKREVGTITQIASMNRKNAENTGNPEQIPEGEHEETEETPKEKATREFMEELKKYEPDEQEFLLERIQIFTPDTDFGHPSMTIPEVELPIKNEKIIPTPPLAKRRYTQKDEEVIDNFIEVSLKSGLICPIQSPTTSALHVVYKNGKPRVVSDLRAVNNLNAGEFQFTFPRPTEKLRELAGKGYKYFTQVDLSGAFTQIPIHKNSYPLLSFTAMTKKHTGTFAYKYLNFGYKCSPAVFSSVLDNILYKINSSDIDGTAINYFDDICLAAKTHEEMKKLLARLFARFAKYNVKLNLKKSKFWQDHCEFCSYRVSEDGYRMSDDRLKLLQEYPDYDVTDRRKNADLKILGFYNYHRSFVKDYAAIEKEIRATIKKYKLSQITAQEANKKIKENTDLIKTRVTETQLECIPDGDECFLQTDASGLSYGYTLFTKKGVIQYGGGSFSPSVASTHSIFEKELMAVALAIKDCFHLINRAGKIIIMCDNLSAVFASTAAKTKRPVTPRTIKYLQQIQTYTSGLDSSIVHIGTDKNVIADALSRMSYDAEGNFDLQRTKDILNHRKGEEESIKETPKPRRQLFSTLNPVYSLNNNSTLYHENVESLLKNIEEECEKFQKNIPVTQISALHAVEIERPAPVELTVEQQMTYAEKLHAATHWSSTKTFYTLQSLGYHISAKVLDRVRRNCESCGKFKKLAPRAKLNPRATTSSTPLYLAHIDHMQLSEQHNGDKYLFTMACDSTRMLFATPVKNKTIIPVISYLQDVQTITNRKFNALSLDRGFDSNYFRDWAAKNNIELQWRPSHLSRPVLVERYHRTLREKIDSFSEAESKPWNEISYKSVISINSQINDTTGFQPAYLFNGISQLPEFGKQKDEERCLEFHRRLAVTKINDSKLDRATDYKYRTLTQGDEVTVVYDHSKNGEKFSATVLSDKGPKHSTICLQLDRSKRVLTVHKSDVLINKFSKNYDKIFET